MPVMGKCQETIGFMALLCDQGNMAAEQVGIQREEDGRAHETDEQIQPGPRMVVHLRPRSERRTDNLRLRVLH